MPMICVFCETPLPEGVLNDVCEPCTVKYCYPLNQGEVLTLEPVEVSA